MSSLRHTLACADAAQSLLDRGYALLKDEMEVMSHVQAAFDGGWEFFSGAADEKAAAATPSRLEGYRPMGAEFSDNPERPDLCEFFSVWGWNAECDDVRLWSMRSPIHAAMSAALPGFAAMANGVLEALLCQLNPDGQMIDVSEASYLQINYYRPRDFADEFLQQAHEDGHVLTFQKATGKGLEVNVDGRFRTIQLAVDEFLVLPGSLLTLVTGGRIQPLFHRVRNDHLTEARQALLYFVNPSIRQETRPWIENESNHDVSIRDIALSCLGAR